MPLCSPALHNAWHLVPFGNETHNFEEKRKRSVTPITIPRLRKTIFYDLKRNSRRTLQGRVNLTVNSGWWMGNAGLLTGLMRMWTSGAGYGGKEIVKLWRRQTGNWPLWLLKEVLHGLHLLKVAGHVCGQHHLDHQRPQLPAGKLKTWFVSDWI